MKRRPLTKPQKHILATRAAERIERSLKSEGVDIDTIQYLYRGKAGIVEELSQRTVLNHFTTSEFNRNLYK